MANDLPDLFGFNQEENQPDNQPIDKKEKPRKVLKKEKKEILESPPELPKKPTSQDTSADTKESNELKERENISEAEKSSEEKTTAVNKPSTEVSPISKAHQAIAIEIPTDTKAIHKEPEPNESKQRQVNLELPESSTLNKQDKATLGTATTSAMAKVEASTEPVEALEIHEPKATKEEAATVTESPSDFKEFKKGPITTENTQVTNQPVLSEETPKAMTSVANAGSVISFEQPNPGPSKQKEPAPTPLATTPKNTSDKTTATTEILKPEKKHTSSLPEWELTKNYYPIGEVAKLFGVNVSHIRFWTKEFKMKPRTTRKGSRLYTPEQIQELRLIHHLVKEEKYTIKGAQELLASGNIHLEQSLDLKEELEKLYQALRELRDQL